jgi:hypothetical protein
MHKWWMKEAKDNQYPDGSEGNMKWICYKDFLSLTRRESADQILKRQASFMVIPVFRNFLKPPNQSMAALTSYQPKSFI